MKLLGDSFLTHFVKNQDDKTSFIIVEICAALFDFIDNNEDLLDSNHSHQFCDTLTRHLSCEELELTSVKSCAKICSILWTNCCHVESFEQIAKHYLQSNHQHEEEVISDVIRKCLKYFLTLHSNALFSSSSYVLQSPILTEIIKILATV